jgi:iron complex outermembrane receptor protein
MWTAEATWRHETADGNLRFGLTAFYNRLDAPQVYGATVPGNRLSLQVFNQEEGESWGIEAEGEWQAGDALRIDAALGLLTTRITRAAAATPDVLGNRFGQDPRATLSLGAVWTPAPDWQVDGRITYVGKTFNDFNNLPQEEVGDYTIVDLGVSRFIGQAELRAYVTNLTDSAGKTRIITGAGADLVAPRTVGLMLTRRF